MTEIGARNTEGSQTSP